MGTILRLVLTLGLLAVSVVLCLWAADFIGGEVASIALKRSALIIGILGAASSGVLLVLGGRRSRAQTPRPPNSGPHF